MLYFERPVIMAHIVRGRIPLSAPHAGSSAFLISSHLAGFLHLRGRKNERLWMGGEGVEGPFRRPSQKHRTRAGILGGKLPSFPPPPTRLVRNHDGPHSHQSSSQYLRPSPPASPSFLVYSDVCNVTQPQPRRQGAPHRGRDDRLPRPGDRHRQTLSSGVLRMPDQADPKGVSHLHHPFDAQHAGALHRVGQGIVQAAVWGQGRGQHAV